MSTKSMLQMYFCADAPSCKRILELEAHVLRGAVWWGQIESESHLSRRRCCRILAWTGSSLLVPHESHQTCRDVGRRAGTCTAEPDWPARSVGSPGAAGTWCPGWNPCEGQPVCWWASRSTTDSAASSGRCPAGPSTDCSESGSEARWTRNWRATWAQRKLHDTVLFTAL